MQALIDLLLGGLAAIGMLATLAVVGIVLAAISDK